MDLAGVNTTTGHESMTTNPPTPPPSALYGEEDEFLNYCHETVFNYNGPPSCFDIIADFGNTGLVEEANTTMNNTNPATAPSSSNGSYNYSDEMMLDDCFDFADFRNTGQEEANATLNPSTPSVFNGLNDDYDDMMLELENITQVLLSDSFFSFGDTAVPVPDSFVCETPPPVPVINQFNMTVESNDNSNDIASCSNDIASCSNTSSNYQTSKQKSSKKSSYTKKAPEQRLIREANTWSHTEHRLLLVGLKAYGVGSWNAIARKLLHPFSRTNTQVSSHYQKYVKHREKNTSDRDRPSIHDVTLEAKDYCDLCLNGFITEEVESLVKTMDTEFWQEVIEERFIRAVMMIDQIAAWAAMVTSETPLGVAPSLPAIAPDEVL